MIGKSVRSELFHSPWFYTKGSGYSKLEFVLKTGNLPTGAVKLLKIVDIGPKGLMLSSPVKYVFVQM